MKYIVLLAVSCLPLAVLTVGSFVQVALYPNSASSEISGQPPGDDKDASPASPISKDISELIEKTPVQTAKDLPLLGDLEDKDLWSIQISEVPSDDIYKAESVPLKAAAKSLKSAKSANQLLDGLALVLRQIAQLETSSDGSLVHQKKTVEEQGGALTDFINATQNKSYSNTASGEDGLKGAAALMQFLSQRASDYQRRSEALQKLIDIDIALTNARGVLEADNFDDCLSRLNRPPLTEVTRANTVTELAMLRQRAEYGRQWQLTMSAAKNSERNRNLLERFDKFLAQFPQPPSEAEADRQREIHQQRDQVDADILLGELRDMPQFTTLVDSAAALTQRLPNRREEIQEIVIVWLRVRGFPRIECPANLRDKHEAWTQNTQRLLGYFYRPPDVDQWRFWRDLSGFTNHDPPHGDESIPSSSLKKDPDVPQYVQWEHAYSEETATVAKRTATRSQWQAFQQWCKTTNAELNEYRNQQSIGVTDEPDRSCAGWSFLDAATIAQDVLDHWDQYQQVMGK